MKNFKVWAILVYITHLYSQEGSVAILLPSTQGQVGQSMVLTNNTGQLSWINTLTDTSLLNLLYTATSADIPLTLVLRDSTGSFSASTINVDSQLNLYDSSPGNYVGLQAPSAVPASYTVTLPATAPNPKQLLLTSSAYPFTASAWSDIGNELDLYVAVNGNDTIGDGSFNNPFASLSRAVDVANFLTEVEGVPAVTINVGAGAYVEDLTNGPITVIGEPITIVGASDNSTIFTSFNFTQTFLYITNSTTVKDLSITSPEAPYLLLCGIAVDTSNTPIGSSNLSSLLNVGVVRCQTGFYLTGGDRSDYFLNGCATEACSVAVNITDARVAFYNHVMAGASLQGSIPAPANTGLLVSGPDSLLVAESTAFIYCNLGAQIENYANVQIIGGSFTDNQNGILCTSTSRTALNGTTFILNSGTNIAAQDFANLQVTACNIDGTSRSGISTGTALYASNGAIVNISSTSLNHLVDGLLVGISGDPNPAQCIATGVTIQNCSDKQIVQDGYASLAFIGGFANSSEIAINQPDIPSNISFNYSDQANDDSTVIGQHFDATQDIIIIDTAEVPTPPALTYQHDYNGSTGLVYLNQTGDVTVLGVESSSMGAQLSAVVGENNQPASVQLYSANIANTIPGPFNASPSNIRGWQLSKQASQAQLSTMFTNNDTTDGKSLVSTYTSYLIDGFNNIINFLTATGTNLPTNPTAVLQWANDVPGTNLYRASASLLQTDGNFAIGSLGAGSLGNALYANPSNIIQISTTNATELGYVHGVTSPIQTQLDSKLSVSGGTLTGPLTLPVGSSSAPSLNFTGFPGTGLSAASGILTLNYAYSPAITISREGNVAINQAASGTTLTVTGGGASISGDLTLPSGFGYRIITDAITINNTPVNPTDGTNKSYVDSVAVGLQVKSPSNVVDVSATTTYGFPAIDGIETTTNYLVLLTAQADGVYNGIWQINNGGIWSRPSDFPSGGSAVGAYTLIQEGDIYAGSSWICTNVAGSATIDTNTLTWVEFSSPSASTNASNIGSGVGVYSSKTGNTLLFNSLAPVNSNIIVNPASAGTITFGLSNNPSISGTFSAAQVNANTFYDNVGTTISGGNIQANTMNVTSLDVAALISTVTIQAADGTAAMPSITFKNYPTTGFSVPNPDTLTFSTAGVNRLQINGSGTINIPAFNVQYGVLMEDSAGNGNISSALITNNNITPGTIQNSSLATIASSDTPGAIVVRDGTGSFAAYNITADNSFLAPNGTATAPSISFTNQPTVGLSSPSVGQLNVISGTGSAAKTQMIFTNGLNIQLPLLTASLPLQLDSSNNIISQDINLTTQVTGILPIANGGTGTTSLGTNAILTSNGSGALAPINLTNGQILIGSSGAAPVAATIGQTANQTTVTNAAGSITIGTVQDIGTTSSPKFNNLTTTGYEIFQGPSSTSVSLGAQTLNATYTLNWPTTVPQTNQALFYSGNNQLSWVTTLTGGIESLNGNTAAAQFLTTSTAGSVVGYTQSGNNTNLLTIPYAGNLLGTGSVGLISGIDYQNFETAYNAVTAATPNDVVNTLVKRDGSGSFVATNVTATGYQVFQSPTTNNSVSLGAQTLAVSYALNWPTTVPQTNQALFYSGNNQLSWVTTLTGGIESLNGNTAAAQFLTTSTAGSVVGYTQSGNNTNLLTIPYAGNLIGTGSVGLISGVDYQNFETAYNAVTAATPNDVVNTLVKRDNTGSFVATNVTATGYQVFQSPTTNNSVSLGAQTLAVSYALNWPTTVPQTNQALFYSGNNQLSWVTTLTGGIESLNGNTAPVQFLTTSTAGSVVGYTQSGNNTNLLTIPYAGNLIGTGSVGLISGVDYQNFETAYNAVTAATPNDVVNTLVKRDGSGSFVATNVTATGYQVFQSPTTNNSVSLGAQTLAVSYALNWPTTVPQTNQALFYSGNNQLSWVTTLTGGIESLNGNTAAAQFLTTSTAGSVVGYTQSGNNTNLLTIPYAGNLIGTGSVGLISGIDYQNFETAYNAVTAATPNDVVNTLVKRDGSGSFVATNVTATGYQVFQSPTTNNSVSLGAQTLAVSYALNWPTTVPQTNQALFYSGNNQLSWVTTLTGGIESLNGNTAAAQFLTTSTAGSVVGYTQSGNNTNLLTIPYAGNLLGTGSVGLISGIDYQNFETAYNAVTAATPNDVVNTLVKRDNTGSFVATNVTATGYQVFQSPTTNNSVSLGAQTLAVSYALNWPTTVPQTNQALFYSGNNQLSWVTTLTGGIESLNGNTAPVQFLTTSTAGSVVGYTQSGNNTNLLTIPYAGNLIGTGSVGLISGIDYQNFETAYNAVTAATPNDVVNTLVKRDNNGSFVATNVTATGYQVFQSPTTNNSVSLGAQTLAVSYALNWPTTVPQTNQALFYSGNNQLSWVTTLTGGIESLNGNTAPVQFLTTSTAGSVVGYTQSGNNTNLLTIPYAGNLLGTGSVGLISGIDYQNFETAYNAVTAATPNDVVNTLVKRDNTGSFVATNVTATGYHVFQSPTTNNSVSLGAQTLGVSYALNWPTTVPQTNQALFYSGNNQLSWVTTLTGGIESLNGNTAPVQFLTTTTAGVTVQWNQLGGNTNQLQIPYAGNVTGANVGLITGADWQNFETAYNAVAAATPNDVVNTLVKRDGTGSFIATNITTTGIHFAAAGSAASPSIQFSGSTNTGLSAGTANTLALSTNGNQVLSINPTGDVTISAPSSGTALTVNGASNAATALSVTGTGLFTTGLEFATIPNVLPAGQYLNAVGSYPASGLRIVTGNVTTVTSPNTPIINYGTGFSVGGASTSGGVVTITFMQPFRSAPVVVATTQGTAGSGAADATTILITSAPTTSTVGFTVSNAYAQTAQNGTFDFIAIGQA